MLFIELDPNALLPEPENAENPPPFPVFPNAPPDGVAELVLLLLFANALNELDVFDDPKTLCTGLLNDDCPKTDVWGWPKAEVVVLG